MDCWNEEDRKSRTFENMHDLTQISDVHVVQQNQKLLHLDLNKPIFLMLSKSFILASLLKIF